MTPDQAVTDLCPSRYGTCGHCGISEPRRHDLCTTRRIGPVAHPVTHLRTSLGVAAAPVWTPSPCVWMCPCPCPKTAPVTQLDLFAEVTQ